MADLEDGFTENNGELAACALCNLENVARMVPGLSDHPMYKIAHMQAKALADRLLS
jgi:hypothetical protein